MFEILQDGHPTLRLISEPHEIGPDTPKFLRKLRETMLDNVGAGLAAPQVGVLTRVFVTLGKFHHDGSEAPEYVINPEIVSTLDALGTAGLERCLSFGGDLYARKISRPNIIIARWTDENGARVEKLMFGYAARVFQHELDHLNGILISDYSAQHVG